MAEQPVGDIEPDAMGRIRKAAIALFRARGYHGTQMRALASIVKIKAGSLYYHFPSKQQILYDNFQTTMNDLLNGLLRASNSATDPRERLRSVIRFHVLFHIDRKNEATISHTEIRSLTKNNQRRIIAKRDLYESMLCDLLAAGVKAGVFQISDIRITAIAILTMCGSVSDWFSESGRLSPEMLVECYQAIVLRMVGCVDQSNLEKARQEALEANADAADRFPTSARSRGRPPH
jgi:AcrR family transcriptional regulator